MTYRTQNELSYYGSDLNKFIAKFCTRKMIVNNIDCIIYKYGQSRIRIIESKHGREKSKKSQLDILKLLSQMKSETTFLEVFMICGDPPYDSVDIFRLNDEKAVMCVERDKLIKFLNFQLEFNDL